MTFKVGDQVEWCGVRGVIVRDLGFPSPKAARLEVEFDESNPLGGKMRERFLLDGRLLYWHREPSLRKV